MRRRSDILKPRQAVGDAGVKIELRKVLGHSGKDRYFFSLCPCCIFKTLHIFRQCRVGTNLSPRNPSRHIRKLRHLQYPFRADKTSDYDLLEAYQTKAFNC